MQRKVHAKPMALHITGHAVDSVEILICGVRSKPLRSRGVPTVDDG